MNTATKIAVGVAAAAAIAGGAVFAALTVFNGDSENPNTTPTTVETTAPVETPAPQPTESTEPSSVDGVDAYNEQYTELVFFTDGSTIASAGDITYDCSQQQPPVEGAFVDAFRIHYADLEHTEVVQLTCSWNIPSEALDELVETFDGALIDENGNPVSAGGE